MQKMSKTLPITQIKYCTFFAQNCRIILQRLETGCWLAAGRLFFFQRPDTQQRIHRSNATILGQSTLGPLFGRGREVSQQLSFNQPKFSSLRADPPSSGGVLKQRPVGCTPRPHRPATPGFSGTTPRISAGTPHWTALWAALPSPSPHQAAGPHPALLTKAGAAQDVDWAPLQQEMDFPDQPLVVEHGHPPPRRPGWPPRQ